MPFATPMPTAEARQALLAFLSQHDWLPATRVFSWGREELGLSTNHVRADVKALIREGRVERRFWTPERCVAHPGPKIGMGTWCDLRAVRTA